MSKRSGSKKAAATKEAELLFRTNEGVLARCVIEAGDNIATRKKRLCNFCRPCQPVKIRRHWNAPKWGTGRHLLVT
jgi:hypothetical protein